MRPVHYEDRCEHQEELCLYDLGYGDDAYNSKPDEGEPALSVIYPVTRLKILIRGMHFPPVSATIV